MSDVNTDETAVNTLRLILIEDNPGDARLIEEMLRDTRELNRRVGTTEGATIARETRLADARDTLAAEPADVVLLDLNLPDSRGLETLEAVSSVAGETPIVVLTGLRDQQVGVQAIQRGAQDFLVKDEVTSALLVRTIHHAIERARQERERRRQREQLEAYNRLNRIGHDITHAVLQTETREALEQRVCDRLVESDAYRFAWLGKIRPGSDEVVPTAAAGIGEDYLETVEITVDPDEPTGQGPTGQAVREGTVQILNGIQSDPAYEPWHEEAEKRGYRSSAAIPIAHEDLLYGVLNVYSSLPRAFSGPEQTVFSRIGDVVAHAITALERKDALVSDAVVELEFRLDAVADSLVAMTEDEDVAIEVEQLIRGDETLLAYGTGRGLSQEAFEDAVEATDAFGAVRFLAVRRDEFEFELVAPAAVSLFETIASHGGRVDGARIEDGEFRFVVELPRGRDTRQMIELITDQREDVTHLAQRTRERESGRGAASQSVLEEELTAKQRAALETAYHAGYFDWPRGSTGEEVAERLGIAPATFNQHLRTAERKFFDSVLGR